MEKSLTEKNNYVNIELEVSELKEYTDEDRDKLQKNLSVIRKVAGWKCSDLGELFGVTKQTINNLESSRTPMTKTQYIAIRAILDYEISSNQENVALAQVVKILLDSEKLTDSSRFALTVRPAIAIFTLFLPTEVTTDSNSISMITSSIPSLSAM